MSVVDGSDAFQAALTGDLQSAHAALAAATPEWRLPLQASLALVDSQFAMPTPTEVEAVALANPSPAVGLACALGEHACFLAFDRAGLADWLALHRRVVDGDPWLTVGEVLLGVFDGDNDRAQAQLAAAEAIPPSVAHAASRIELVALRGLLALELGDGDAALRFARRAVRMARTEEFPQQQYLAGMVLARVRRYAHQQHLAVRILAALERVAPERWRPWIGWELTLAGSSEDRAVSFADARLSPAVSHLKTALRAASHGERAPWDAAMNHALAAAPAVWIRRELEVLRLLIDPELESAEPWVAGRGPLPPRGLLPVGTHPEEPDAAVMAFVSVHNDGRARRILGVGVALAAGPQLSSSRPGRLETAISVLALAGDVGIGLREFFHEVYHFDYEAGLHKGASRSADSSPPGTSRRLGHAGTNPRAIVSPTVS
ncbi:MAG: hypothetical protein AAGF12_24720 [Myxococcota bacterium]